MSELMQLSRWERPNEKFISSYRPESVSNFDWLNLEKLRLEAKNIECKIERADNGRVALFRTPWTLIDYRRDESRKRNLKQ